MVVYRVGKKQYATDLSGEGARLFGGRWNLAGTPCLYTSESRALAVLEFSVNLNIYEISKALSFTIIEIPNSKILQIEIAQLPATWNHFPVTTETKIFGDALIKNSDKAVIKIPSVIISTEFNYILNPFHNNNSKFKILEIEDFVYDKRIKTIG